MDKKKTKPSKKKVAEATIPVKWHIPDTIITRFATNIVVQIIENEFKITFFEIKPEIYLEPSQKPSGEVQAECVASVIVTADRLPRFIEVLLKQVDQYTSRKQKIKK